jgi:hypothetical protein
MDDYLEDKFILIDKFFKIASREVFGFVIKKIAFKKILQKKSRNIDKSLADLNKQIDKIGNDNLSMDELHSTGIKIDAIIADLGKAFKESWTNTDKDNFHEIMDEYYRLNIRNSISIRLINELSKNDFFKLVIQFSVFLLTFLGTYIINPYLDKYLLPLGQFWSQFIIALVLFLSLEKILQLLEEYLLYWRVMKLFISYAYLYSIIKKAQEVLDKN